MILIGLGANLPSRAGEPAATLRAALAEFAPQGIHVERISPFYRSVAWPNRADPPFVNAVAIVFTELEPASLLRVLHGIEANFGRTRREPNAPRVLDLDVLDYQGRVEVGPPTLPHPRMAGRAFVLFPLRDIAPHWRHPVSGCTVSELIEMLSNSELPKQLGA